MKINEIQYEEGLTYVDNNEIIWKVKNESLINAESGYNICTTYSTKELFEVEFEMNLLSNDWKRAEVCGKYFTTAATGVDDHYEDNDGFDSKAWDRANYFTSESLAHQIDNSQTLYRTLLKFRDENDSNWNERLYNDELHSLWYIYYDHDFNCFEVTSCFRAQHLHTVYFSSPDIATRAMNEIIIPFCKENNMFNL